MPVELTSFIDKPDFINFRKISCGQQDLDGYYVSLLNCTRLNPKFQEQNNPKFQEQNKVLTLCNLCKLKFAVLAKEQYYEKTLFGRVTKWILRVFHFKTSVEKINDVIFLMKGKLTQEEQLCFNKLTESVGLIDVILKSKKAFLSKEKLYLMDNDSKEICGSVNRKGINHFKPIKTVLNPNQELFVSTQRNEILIQKNKTEFVSIIKSFVQGCNYLIELLKDMTKEEKKYFPEIVAMGHKTKFKVFKEFEEFEEFEKEYLIMKNVSNDLEKEWNRIIELSLLEKIEICEQMLDAITIMHKHGFAHRNLKRDNITIDKNNKIKIIDFDMAEKLTNRKFKQKGNPLFRPPSFLQSNPSISNVEQRKKHDSYSIGLIMFQIFSRRPYLLWESPFGLIPRKDRFELKDDWPEQYLPENFDTDLVKLLNDMLKNNPKDCLLVEYALEELRKIKQKFMPSNP